MMRDDIREADWKIFKELHGIAMERFFQRAVAGLALKAGNDRNTNRTRFWDVHEQVAADARAAAEMFDGSRRSRAMWMLLRWRAEGLIKEEEMGRFSIELQESVKSVLDR
jgi:hypothetical protein